LRALPGRRESLAVEPDDVQTVMKALFDLRVDTQEILKLLREDEDGEEEADDT
jgi:hypothetical protein